jgi:hypothetical protein
MGESPKRRERGRVGEEIFKQIESLVSRQNLPRSKAFEQLAKKTGRKPGTVAANYYRVARKRGAPLQPRRKRSGSISVQRVVAALREAADLVTRQEAEIDALRRECARLAQIRRLVARG